MPKYLTLWAMDTNKMPADPVERTYDTNAEKCRDDEANDLTPSEE
jgi:hypothetical protein